MKSFVTKLIIWGCVLAICGVIYAIEYKVSTEYSFELCSVSQEESVDSDGPAIANTTNYIKIKVTKNGEPVAGHTIYYFPKTLGAKLMEYRQVTDEAGMITFRLIPPGSTPFDPLQDVVLEFRNESNSLIFEVNAKKDILIKVTEEDT